MEDLTVCGYRFPTTHSVRKAIVVAVKEFESRGWVGGIKQDEFLNLAVKAGYTAQTITMGGTRRYFCPASEDSSPADKALTTYGIFFTRTKVGRSYQWFPIRENCESVLQYADQIIKEAKDAARQSIENKFDGMVNIIKHATKFADGSIVTLRQSQSHRGKLYTADDLHKSIASNNVPYYGMTHEHNQILMKEMGLITGKKLDAWVLPVELPSITYRMSRSDITRMMESLRDIIIDWKWQVYGEEYRHPIIKLHYPEVIILGTSKLGFIDPTCFKLTKSM